MQKEVNKNEAPEGYTAEAVENIFDVCSRCDLREKCMKERSGLAHLCSSDKREDGQSVYFKKIEKEEDTLDGLIKFQKDRALHLQEYSALNEHANIYEEMMESIGCAVLKENREMLKREVHDMQGYLVSAGIIEIVKKPPLFKKDEQVDAYADIIVFAVGAIMKLGYDPKKVLKEVSKEINSREGEMVDGKFQKDTSPEAKSKWYKADFTECTLEEEQ